VQLHDYTSLFQVEKKWRRIDNITIPEISYRAALWGGGAALISSTIWFTLVGRVIGLLPLPGLLTVALPVLFITITSVAMGKAATTRMRYGKELTGLVGSWIKYRRNPKRFIGFIPWSGDTVTRVEVETIIDTRTPPATFR
jgi:hypothetical protein